MCYTPFLCCNSYSWITQTLRRCNACFEAICTEWAWSKKRTFVIFPLRELFQKKTHKGSVFHSRRVEYRSLEAPWPQLRPAMNGSFFITCRSDLPSYDMTLFYNYLWYYFFDIIPTEGSFGFLFLLLRRWRIENICLKTIWKVSSSLFLRLLWLDI